MKLAAISALIGSAAAFPALLNLDGKAPLLDLDLDLRALTGSGKNKTIDLSVLELNQKAAKANTFKHADPKNCPVNKDHKPAAKWNSKFPYNHAKNGLPGKGKGGYLVPHPDDEDHKFIHPGPNDIRGPCPGMNTLANHGFIARDGITDLNEVVDACQNVFNMSWDLSVVITMVALVLGDGDLVSRKFSIGCDATDRTAAVPLIAGSQPGLNGHNNFEADASMGRNDFFLAEGDNFSLNGTKFGRMVEVTEGEFTVAGLSKYREECWHRSQSENPNFFFGPAGLLLYGDAAFLPKLMASGSRDYKIDTETVATFFGAYQKEDGSWAYGHNETIPENFVNREEAYNLVDEVHAILEMYLQRPVLFGGNTAEGHFNGIDFGAIKDGKIDADASVDDALCLIYQLLTSPMPGLLNGVTKPLTGALDFITSTVSDTLTNLGCPAPLNAN